MKQVPCYICRKAVTAKSDLAIVKLCSEHDTAENRDKMKNASYEEIMRIYNWFVEHNRGEGEGGNNKPIPPKKKMIGTNEYGEPIYEE